MFRLYDTDGNGILDASVSFSVDDCSSSFVWIKVLSFYDVCDGTLCACMARLMQWAVVACLYKVVIIELVTLDIYCLYSNFLRLHFMFVLHFMNISARCMLNIWFTSRSRFRSHSRLLFLFFLLFLFRSFSFSLFLFLFLSLSLSLSLSLFLYLFLFLFLFIFPFLNQFNFLN